MTTDRVGRYIALGEYLRRADCQGAPLTTPAIDCVESVRVAIWRRMRGTERMRATLTELRLNARQVFTPLIMVRDAREVRR